MKSNLRVEKPVTLNSNSFLCLPPSRGLNSQYSSPRSYNNRTPKTPSKPPKSEIDEVLEILACESNRDEVRQYLKNLM